MNNPIPSSADTEERRLAGYLSITDDLADAWMNRPLAAIFVPWLIPTPVTPNQVTFISFVLGVIGAAFIVCFHDAAAGFFLWLSIVVDCVDGQLARAKKMTSEWGDVYDHTSDDLSIVLCSGAVAYRFFHAGVGLLMGLSITVGALLTVLLLTGSQYYFSLEAYGVIRNRRHGRLSEDIERIRSMRDRYRGAPRLLLSYYLFRDEVIRAMIQFLYSKSYKWRAAKAGQKLSVAEAVNYVESQKMALWAWRCCGVGVVATTLNAALVAGKIEEYPRNFLIIGLAYTIGARCSQRIIDRKWQGA